MKAYIINGSEIYAAEGITQAIKLHEACTGGDEVEQAELLENDFPWNDEDPDVTAKTIGDLLRTTTFPGFLGSI